MSDVTESNPPETPGDQLDRSTYEIIRNRLESHAEDLRNRLEQLNELRRDVFGSIPTELVGTERISTANNCVARDIVSVGEAFVFGYNVQIGLRSETRLEDVFSVYHCNDGHFHEASLDLIRCGNFELDFQQLYKYYKETSFSKFQVIGPFLYMVFRVGRSQTDVKSFKFLIDGISFSTLTTEVTTKFGFLHNKSLNGSVRTGIFIEAASTHTSRLTIGFSSKR